MKTCVAFSCCALAIFLLVFFFFNFFGAHAIAQVNVSASVPSVCGNGVVDPGEQCDGSNLNGQTCIDKGFRGGTLSCNSDCTFNAARCTLSSSQVLLSSSTVLNTVSSQVVVTDADTNPSTITIPSNVKGASLDASSLLTGSSVTLPTGGDVTANATTPVGTVSVAITGGTTITASGAWNGIINLPQVTSLYTAPPTSPGFNSPSIVSAIEIGAGNTPLIFNKSVRIDFAGQAGNPLGWSENGTFAPITATCSADTQTVGDTLAPGGDCTITSGSDLVVWTKHFTTFITYAQTAVTASSPAQIIVNDVGSVTVPNIGADITITNEGLAGYEYDYAWCVVANPTSSCDGGSQDIFYAAAAKFINPRDNFNTVLTATVPNPGVYYFKVVVYFGTESSIAFRSFTATAASIGGGGGSTSGGEDGGGGGGGGGGGSTSGGSFSTVSTSNTSATITQTSCSGADLNHDGKVNAIDFSILLAFWGTPPPFKNPCVDINHDNKVNTIDFSIMMYEWGKYI